MKTVLLFILIGICNMSLPTQQTVSSAGGNAATGGEGTVSYTIGQVVYTTNTQVRNKRHYGVYTIVGRNIQKLR